MNLESGRTRLIILIILPLLLNSCFAAHLVAGFKELGVTESDRKALLSPQVKKFHDAAETGRIMAALTMVEDESRELFRTELRNISREEKVVERKIEIIDFLDSAYEVNVELLVKFYRQPNYIVTERIEKERWIYHTKSGWKILSREFSDL